MTTTRIHRWLTKVYLSFKIRNNRNTSVVELHPLALTLNYSIVVTELQSLAFMHHDALQMVYFNLVESFQPQFLWKRNSIAQFLLLESLRVDAEALQVHQQ